MPLTIEIFENRLTFTNPGPSLNDVNRLIDLPPNSRNELLAQMMLLLHMCERRGSGIDRATDAIGEMKLPAYKAQSGDDYTRITLYPKKKVSEMTREECIAVLFSRESTFEVKSLILKITEKARLTAGFFCVSSGSGRAGDIISLEFRNK